MKLYKKFVELLLPQKYISNVPSKTRNWTKIMSLLFLELELEFEFCEEP